MSGLRERLRRLEAVLARRPCPDCGGSPQRFTFVEGLDVEPIGEAACPVCGREAHVIRFGRIQGITLADHVRERGEGRDDAS